MKYKAVLFDMDGVVWDSEPLHFDAFQTVLLGLGYTLTPQDYEAYFGGKTDKAGFIEYFKSLNQTVDLPAVMQTKADTFLKLASGHIKPYPGIIELIKALADEVPIALVTGSLRAEAEAALKSFGIYDCFAAIVTAEDVVNSKPNPEGYLKAAKLLRTSPGDCVIVEDTPSGVGAARAAAIDCIAITTTHTATDLHEATQVVDRLDLSLF